MLHRVNSSGLRVSWSKEELLHELFFLRGSWETSEYIVYSQRSYCDAID